MGETFLGKKSVRKEQNRVNEEKILRLIEKSSIHDSLFALFHFFMMRGAKRSANISKRNDEFFPSM
jgi:hypothetical protein